MLVSLSTGYLLSVPPLGGVASSPSAPTHDHHGRPSAPTLSRYRGGRALDEFSGRPSAARATSRPGLSQ
jgi:hypothetical protein